MLISVVAYLCTRGHFVLQIALYRLRTLSGYKTMMFFSPKIAGAIQYGNFVSGTRLKNMSVGITAIHHGVRSIIQTLYIISN